MNEQEAIAQLKAGDVRGLEVLVRKYQLDAVRIANSITDDWGWAEELAQEAFLRVYRCIDQFDDTRPFRAWFLRIVMNDALKAVTRQNRLLPFDSTDDLSDSQVAPVPEADALWFEQEEFSDTHDDAAALQEILDHLSLEHRAVLELKYYLDMTDQEIAETLSIPIGTVKSRLHLAKLNCRSWLKREDYSLACR